MTKPYYQWTEEEKYVLAEKLKRTLDDELVDELMRDVYLSYDQLQRIADAHENWEIMRDEMAAARYQAEVKIIPALRGQVAKMKELLDHVDECFGWCSDCDGAGYFPRGPYQDECQGCLGYSFTVRDMRGLLAAYHDIATFLRPDEPAFRELHDPYEEE